jgi:hypothetical protein
MRPQIELERGAPDRLLPKDFVEILTRRYFPVLGLTYVGSVIGIAAQQGDVVFFLFNDKLAYIMGLFVALWVSIPAILWIILKGTPIFREVADVWYKIVAAIMVVTLLMSYVLLPEMNPYGLRVYFAATLPVFVVMYVFFVKGGLPAVAAHVLSALGLSFLIYGAILNYLH